LAPELSVSNRSRSGLASLASNFGINLGSNNNGVDAIFPTLYPDLMNSVAFKASLFPVKVQRKDDDTPMTYYDYLKNHQKDAWFKYPLHWIKELLPKDADSNEENVAFDPYDLSRADNDIAEAIRGNIKISIDKKTGVITIVTKAQDKLICKTLADSVMSQLQEFIIDYRTNKARNDYEYYKKLVADAKSDYETVRRKYGATSDANMEVTMKSMELLLTDLENDMQLKFNTYTTMCTQLEAAKAKVQDRTPAFTIIEGAAVPVKPAGPKRMIFVIGMMFLTFIGTAFYITKKDFHFSF
jgi:capsule polysaccharide export protein KpsE/RkpR